MICMSGTCTGKSKVLDNAFSMISKTDYEPLKYLINKNSIEIRITYNNNSNTKYSNIDQSMGADASLGCRILASYFNISFLILSKFSNINQLTMNIALQTVLLHHYKNHNTLQSQSELQLHLQSFS